MKKLIIAFMLFSQFGTAKDYYFASSGSDAGAGTQGAPYATITKLNTLTLASGDKILFNRGDIFPGQVSVKTNGVTYDAYGTGANPIINGAVAISGWTLDAAGVYKATVTQDIKNTLFFKYVQQVYARTPNITQAYPYIKIAANTGTATVNLGQTSAQFAGSRAIFRTVDWQFDMRDVASVSGTSVTLSSAPPSNGTSNYVLKDYGIYFQGKQSFLDDVNEWYYDKGTKTVYYKPKSGTAPANGEVTGSVYDYGFKSTTAMSDVTIQNIDVTGQALDGINFLSTANVNNTNININHCNVYGIYAGGIVIAGTNITIADNNVHDINATGISTRVGSGWTKSKIIRNTVSNIGLIAGQGLTDASGDAINNWVGIYMADRGNTTDISDNVLNHIGYSGIRSDGTFHTIKRNLIMNTCQSLSDGGAIYCWGLSSSNQTWSDNIIINVKGNGIGTPGNATEGIAIGLYVDNLGSMININHNVVKGANGAGVNINFGATDNTVSNNIIYGSPNVAGSSGLTITEQVDGDTYGNKIQNNVFYGLGEAQHSFLLISAYDSKVIPTAGFASFSGNYYLNPYNSAAVDATTLVAANYVHNYYSPERWVATTANGGMGMDVTGKISPYAWSAYDWKSGADKTADNILKYNGKANPTFDADPSYSLSGADGSVWGNSGFDDANVSVYTGAQLSHSTGLLDGGSLTLTRTGAQNGIAYTPATDHQSTAPWDNGFSFDTSKYYRVMFDVISPATGSKYGNLTMQSIAVNDWVLLESPSKLFAFSSTRKSYDYIYKARNKTGNFPHARIDFTINTPEKAVALDNVYAFVGTATLSDPSSKNIILINNSATTAAATLGGTWTNPDGYVYSLLTTYKNIDNQDVTGSVQIPAYGAVILISQTTTPIVLGANDALANETVKASMMVFPSPSEQNGVIGVQLPTLYNGNVTVDIINISGQLVQSVSAESASGVVSNIAHNLDKGMYVVKVRTIDNNYSTKLVVK